MVGEGRIPIVPLSYENRDWAVVGELVVNRDNGHIYVKTTTNMLQDVSEPLIKTYGALNVYTLRGNLTKDTKIDLDGSPWKTYDLPLLNNQGEAFEVNNSNFNIISRELYLSNVDTAKETIEAYELIKYAAIAGNKVRVYASKEIERDLSIVFTIGEITSD